MVGMKCLEILNGCSFSVVLLNTWCFGVACVACVSLTNFAERYGRQGLGNPLN